MSLRVISWNDLLLTLLHYELVIHEHGSALFIPELLCKLDQMESLSEIKAVITAQADRIKTIMYTLHLTSLILSSAGSLSTCGLCVL